MKRLLLILLLSMCQYAQTTAERFAVTGMTNGNLIFQGAYPYVDVTAFGVRAVSSTYTNGLTGNISSGSATLAISSSWPGVNGDGIAVAGAGATNSTAAPSAPAVVASVPTASLDTHYTVAAPAGGSTSRCYKVAWVRQGYGVTAASPETCVTAQAPGAGTLTIKSQSRSNNVTTVTTATRSPEIFSVGEWVSLQGSSDIAHFDGWVVITSVPNNTTFTYTSGMDSRNSGGTSATGGTIYYYNCNHVSFGTPPSGAWQAAIYSGESGAETWVAMGEPVNASLSTEPTYQTWDDFGTTMSAGATQPWYIPTKPLSSAINDLLVTTVSSGAGTTTLTLAATAGNTVSSGAVRFDNTPNIVTAVSAAASTGGAIYFPAVSSTGIYYLTNSFMDLSSYSVTVKQAGPIALNGTVKLNLYKWYGDPAGNTLSTAQFQITPLVQINTGSAVPGFYTTLLDFTNVDFVGSGNSYNCIFSTGNLPTGILNNVIAGGGSNDYMGVAIKLFNPPTGSSAGFIFNNVLLTSDIGVGHATTATPSLLVKNFGEMNFNGIMMSRKGIYLQGSVAGMNVDFNQEYECQGCVMPMITVAQGTGTSWMKVRNTTLDTSIEDLIACLGNCGVNFSIDGNTSTGEPIVSGAAGSVFQIESSSPSGQALQNNVQTVSGIIYDGFYAPTGATGAETIQNAHLAMGGGYSLFTKTVAPPAPTCSVATAGPPYTPPGTYQYRYGGIYPPYNGVGSISGYSNSCTANGTSQQITVTIPAALPGVSGYAIWRGYDSLLTCTLPTTTTLSYIMTSVACGQISPSLPGGGPAGVSSTTAWAVSEIVGSGHINQFATNNLGGTCSMSSSTSCTVTLSTPYNNTPICIVTAQGSSAIAAACAVSGTTVTVTAASSNSLTWSVLTLGNPN